MVKRKKKISLKMKIIIITIISSILLSITGGYLYYKKNNNLDTSIDNSTKKSEEKKEELEFTEVKGVTNILLLSNDARKGETVSRADSIMVVTLDTNNKSIKLTSLMRDMLVDIEGHGEEKLNHAYAYGGPKLMMDTIERNFKIKLDKYVTVDFRGFVKIVDLLGGVDAEIKDYELKELNKYILDGGGSKSDLIKKTGPQTLNGYQALSYARIRKIGNGEYERTERQRKLISSTIEKLKGYSLFKMPGLIKEGFKYIDTNLNLLELTDIGLTALKMNLSGIDTLRLPLDNLSHSSIFKSKGWVLVIDKDENAKVLKEFIFNNNKNYIPDTSNMNYIVQEYKEKYGTQSYDASKHDNINDYEEENNIDKKPIEKPIEKPVEKDEVNNDKNEEANKEEKPNNVPEDTRPTDKPSDNNVEKPTNKPEDTKPTNPNDKPVEPTPPIEQPSDPSTTTKPIENNKGVEGVITNK